MGAESLLNPIGLGLGLIGSIGKMFGNGKANRELRALEKQNPIYKANPLAAQRLALAQTLLNARSPGSMQVERNIYGSAANQNAGIDRNATDANSALLAKTGTFGQELNAFNKLGLNEAEDYQRRYGNLTNAQEGQINEDDKVFGDETRRFQDKLQIGGAINANRQNSWGSLSNLGFGISDFATNGGFGGGGNGMSRGMGWNPSRQGFNSSGRATGVF